MYFLVNIGLPYVISKFDENKLALILWFGMRISPSDLKTEDFSTHLNKFEFEKLVQEGFLLIPEWFREKIKNVALLVEDEPSEEIRRQEGIEAGETLLGLYQGIPATERGDSYGVGPTMPDTITLYQLTIEAAAREDGIDVRTVIAETIWHEYAHYFGMDETQVRIRESARTSDDELFRRSPGSSQS